MDRSKDKKMISYWQEVSTRFFKNKAAFFGFFTLVILFVMAIIGPYITPYTYSEIHLEVKNSAPSLKFWFGTDELGRDIFTRLFYGTRISLTIGIAAALVDLLIGVIYGSFSAITGGMTDEIMTRICDILYAIPHLLMVILLMVVMGPGIITIIIALTITGWINMARIVRGQVLQLKESDFVLAATILGASKKRIIFKHLLPNAMGPIIATMTLTIPTAIFAEAFLSFLGLGIQAPVSSLGVMVNDGLGALRYYPWRLFFPASMITIIMLSFNLVGDALRDAFDPRLIK